MDWILASASKSRRQLLDASGVQVRVVPSSVDESPVHAMADRLSAGHMAWTLARNKAEDVSGLYPTSWVIGADQILSVNGQLVTKPASRQEAAYTLDRLQGRWHRLTAAAVVVRDRSVMWSMIDHAEISMRPLGASEIHDYLAMYWDDVRGTVGAYRWEAEGVTLFQETRGSYATILGLPLLPLLAFIRRRQA